MVKRLFSSDVNFLADFGVVALAIIQSCSWIGRYPHRTVVTLSEPNFQFQHFLRHPLLSDSRKTGFPKKKVNFYMILFERSRLILWSQLYSDECVEPELPPNRCAVCREWLVKVSRISNIKRRVPSTFSGCFSVVVSSSRCWINQWYHIHW